MPGKRKRPTTTQALGLGAADAAGGGRGRHWNRGRERCEASPSSGNRDTSASLERSRRQRSPRHAQLRQRQQQMRAASCGPELDAGQSGQRKGSPSWKQDQHLHQQHPRSHQQQQHHPQHHCQSADHRKEEPNQGPSKRKRQRQQQQDQKQQQQIHHHHHQHHKQEPQPCEPSFPATRINGEHVKDDTQPQQQQQRQQHHHHQQQQHNHHHHHHQQHHCQLQPQQLQRQQSPNQNRSNSQHGSAAPHKRTLSPSQFSQGRQSLLASSYSYSSSSSSSGSSYHLLKYLETSLPVSKRLELVEDCLERVRLVVRQLWGADAAVVLQGSYAQGLAVGSSDLDIAIVPNGHGKDSGGQEAVSKRQSRRQRRRCRKFADEHDNDDENKEMDEPLNSQGNAENPPEDFDHVDRKKAITLLKSLAKAIAELGSEELKVHQQILHAQVPILRLVGRSEGISKVIIDISVGTTLYRGVCDRYVHRLMESDPSGRAAALCRAVKLWAKKRRLSDTMRGGMSSFSWVLLVIFFLQNSKEFGLPTLEKLFGGITKASRDGSCSKQHNLPCRGHEVSVITLLKKFFDWVVDSLPEHSRASLSVLSGRAEALGGGGSNKSGGGGGGGSNKTVFIQVPFKPNDNAARCLRSDVWGRQIVPELSRVRNLLTQLHQGTERQKAFAVKSLFAGKGSSPSSLLDGPAQDDFSSDNEDSDVLSAAFSRRESSVESNAPKRRRRSSGDVWREVSRSCDTGRSPSLGPQNSRKAEASLPFESSKEADKEKEKESEKAIKAQAPTQTPVQDPPPVPASVSRFLQLRAMMSGGLA